MTSIFNKIRGNIGYLSCLSVLSIGLSVFVWTRVCGFRSRLLRFLGLQDPDPSINKQKNENFNCFALNKSRIRICYLHLRVGVPSRDLNSGCLTVGQRTTNLATLHPFRIALCQVWFISGEDCRLQHQGGEGQGRERRASEKTSW